MVDRVKVMDIVSDVGVKMVIVVDSVIRKNVISSFSLFFFFFFRNQPIFLFSFLPKFRILKYQSFELFDCFDMVDYIKFFQTNIPYS